MVKLIEYLPQFMQNFAELKELFGIVDDEIGLIHTQINKFIDNTFIESADEYGIKKYETILGITPSADDTIESRRARVLLRWNSAASYTMRVLINRLNTMYGVNQYDLSEDLSNYYLCIKIQLGLYGQVDELEKMLEKILPKSMYYEIDNDMTCVAKGDALCAGGTVIMNQFTLTDGVANVQFIKIN